MLILEMQKYIIEFIGTFFLLLVIALSANPLAVGAVLISMVYMGGYVSGAHYNPAVTVAVFLRKKITGNEAMKYILFQFLGAIAASVIYFLIQDEKFLVQMGPQVPFINAFLLEAIFTFALCSVVLHTATAQKNTPNQFYGLAIGLVVMAGAFSVGTISGAAFNPAVGVGPLLMDFLHITDHITEVALYTLGPLTGAFLAALLFNEQFLGKKK